MTTAGVPLRANVLDGLGYAVDTLRAGHQECADCTRYGRACPDRQRELAEADLWDGTAAFIRRVASDHWLITALRDTTNRGNPA